LVIGQRLWKTDDPELTRRLRATFEGPARRLVPLEVTLEAAPGMPLVIAAAIATGLHARVESPAPLATAEKHPATPEGLRAQFDRLGGTVYALGAFEARITGQPLVPSSLLNQLRRQVVDELDTAARAVPPRAIAEDSVLAELRAAIPRPDDAGNGPAAPRITALCRNTEQAVAALAAGAAALALDYQHIKQYGPAIAALRDQGAREIWIAPPRIEKPGEGNLFRFLEKQGADGLLVRNAGSLAYCTRRGIPFVVDFSLNAANELTVAWLRARGARRVTASYDLSFDQLDDLLQAAPPDWLEIVIHQHMPMFHMEHCVYCAFLSPGTDRTNCGRPCDRHDVKLRDRVGMEHPLKADIGCRNTLYNAVPQTAAEFLPRLLARGARHLRVEFLDDTPADIACVLGLYQQVIAGQRDGRTLWKDLKAINRYGVTRGQLAVL
jgi:putative protease